LKKFWRFIKPSIQVMIGYGAIYLLDLYLAKKINKEQENDEIIECLMDEVYFENRQEQDRMGF